MAVKIKFQTLQNKHFTFNAAVFLPEPEKLRPIRALFTHGYTASKSDNIPWAQRLSENGIPCVIFDLPGHYLGSINQVESFEVFKENAHRCFETADEFLSENLAGQKAERYVLGGHSLGALLSVKAMELERFEKTPSLSVAVGLGISQHKSAHLFASSFYEKTLNIRRQLVAPALDSDNVFPWINDEKDNIAVSGKRVHLITGEDDAVVGAGGMQALQEKLKANGNQVTSHEPKSLPHHRPGQASAHVYHFLKKELPL